MVESTCFVSRWCGTVCGFLKRSVFHAARARWLRQKLACRFFSRVTSLRGLARLLKKFRHKDTKKKSNRSRGLCLSPVFFLIMNRSYKFSCINEFIIERRFVQMNFFGVRNKTSWNDFRRRRGPLHVKTLNQMISLYLIPSYRKMPLIPRYQWW